MAECAACTRCSPTEFEVAPCRGADDRVCASCATSPFYTCPDGFYRVGACGDGTDGFSCSPCASCASGVEWASGGCTVAQDTVCSNCTACAEGLVERAPCTSTTDRACAPAASESRDPDSQSSVGMIVGIVLGVLVLAAALFFYMRRGGSAKAATRHGAFENPAYVMGSGDSSGDPVYDSAE